jgi:hypothetical protein
MKKKNRFFSKLNVLTLLLLGMMAVIVYSQEPGSNPVADPRFSPSEIIWVPLVNFSSLDLTIARPDGTMFSRTFEGGSTPYVDISDILGEGRLDGSYIYELRAIMDVKKKHREDDNVEIRYSTAPLVQSGSFSVLEGRIMDPEEGEPDADKGASISGVQDGLSGTQDYVINDDLIVDGSACIGFDCVNGESFGFDTLRLKENNLRIKFDDTSTLSSFPRNDWQLTANDSANGGASKFSIDDITNARTPFTVEANARSNSLYVDDGGRIGIRTSTPSLEIHVVDGDTPGLRLQQDGSSGFAPQTWDIAGNETNFFVRDVTNGSTLPFRIRPGAPSSSIFIDVGGNIGFRTSSPGYPVHLKTDSSTNAEIVAERTGGATNFLSASASYGFFGTTSNHPVRVNVNGSYKMQLNADNSLAMASGATCTAGGVWTSVSSRDAKENIKNLSADEAIKALDGLNPVTFNYKAEKEEQYVGFIAEDVPELVASKDKKHLTPMDVVAVLTKVVQEQQKMAQEQQRTISELKEKIANLEKKQSQ